MSEKSRVKIEIHNIKGQKVKTLYDNIINKGQNTIIWDSRDENGKALSSGMFFASLNYKGKQTTQKMILMK